MEGKQKKMTYAVRVCRHDRSLGWLANIGYDLIAGKETFELRRYRRDAKKFVTKQEAIDFVRGSSAYGTQGYYFQYIGTHKEKMPCLP